MSDTAFASLPRGTRLRIAAKAVLAAAVPLVEGRVFLDRQDPVQLEDYPCLLVFSTERRDTIGAAGGPPIFKVGYTLRIQGMVIAADADRATILCDQLRQAALDGLMSDPIWPGLVESVSSVEEKRVYGENGGRKIEEFMIDVSTAWRDRYTPDNTTPLLAGGQPAGLRTVAVPLKTIVNTEQLGTDDQGHKTLFVVDTSLPQA